MLRQCSLWLHELSFAGGSARPFGVGSSVAVPGGYESCVLAHLAHTHDRFAGVYRHSCTCHAQCFGVRPSPGTDVMGGMYFYDASLHDTFWRWCKSECKGPRNAWNDCMCG